MQSNNNINESAISANRPNHQDDIKDEEKWTMGKVFDTVEEVGPKETIRLLLKELSLKDTVKSLNYMDILSQKRICCLMIEYPSLMVELVREHRNLRNGLDKFLKKHPEQVEKLKNLHENDVDTILLATGNMSMEEGFGLIVKTPSLYRETVILNFEFRSKLRDFLIKNPNQLDGFKFVEDNELTRDLVLMGLMDIAQTVDLVVAFPAFVDFVLIGNQLSRFKEYLIKNPHKIAILEEADNTKLTYLLVISELIPTERVATFLIQNHVLIKDILKYNPKALSKMKAYLEENKDVSEQLKNAMIMSRSQRIKENNNKPQESNNKQQEESGKHKKRKDIDCSEDKDIDKVIDVLYPKKSNLFFYF